MRDVIMVRAYLTEGDRLLKAVMQLLHDEIKVKGVTVFRAISGFGREGVVHSAELLTLSLDLPLVVEFFDSEAIIDKALEKLKPLLPADHIVKWSATVV